MYLGYTLSIGAPSICVSRILFTPSTSVVIAFTQIGKIPKIFVYIILIYSINIYLKILISKTNYIYDFCKKALIIFTCEATGTILVNKDGNLKT